MQPSLRSADHQNYQFTLMSKIFLSCTGLFLLSLLTACGGRPNVTVNISSAETAKTESASNRETQEQSKTPQTPSSQQEADSSSAIATATEKPIQPLKPEPTESSPTSLASANSPIYSNDFGGCHGSYLLERMETVDYEISICYDIHNRRPSYYQGNHKRTGESISVQISEYDFSENTRNYLATNGDVSYAITSDLQKWPHGALIVRQGSKELLREPMKKRDLILEGGPLSL